MLFGLKMLLLSSREKWIQKYARTPIGYFQIVFSEFIKHGIIISKKKIALCQTYINFLGITLGDGKIKLQPHIAKKVLEMPDNLSNIKDLQTFLGLLNCARNFIKDLGKIPGPLYSKTAKNGQKTFNHEDIKLVQKIKQLVVKLPDLNLSVDADYIIIETDGCAQGWGAVLKAKPHKYSLVKEEKCCGYASGKYKEKGYIASIDAELLAVVYALDSFRLSIINKMKY